MDILQQDNQSIKINCLKHPDNIIKFIQTQQINHDNLFYCLQCADDDDEDFKIQNYVLLDKIQVQNDNQIIDKWPPLQDKSLHKKLQQLSLESKDISQLSSKVETFFERMKLEVIEKIESVKKIMINKSQSFPNVSNEIQQKYQELSKSKQLKEILIDANLNSEQKQNKFRDLIKQLYYSKQNNTQVLNELIQKYDQNQMFINFETPNKIKSSIMQLIDQINIFTLDINIIQQLNNSQFENNLVKTEQLFNLISSQSNYCSENFLTSIKSLFNQISPLIEKISFEDAFIKDKKSIDFSKLNKNQLDLVGDFSVHLSRISNEQKQEMKNNRLIKQIMSILELKSNYLKQDFLIEFENYLIETFPLLNKVKFDQIFLSNSKIEVFQEISDETLDKVVELTQKINENNKNGNKISNLTLKIKEQYYDILKYNFQKEDLEKLYSNYPIFDLLNAKLIYILPQLQMIKTNFSQSQQLLQIEKNQNNSISIQLSQNCNFYQSTYCVSDLILDQNRSYVFRFQLVNNSQDEKHVNIGLVRDSQKDSQHGWSDNMSCKFKINQNSFYYGGNGIDKKEKGDFSVLKCQEIEMRVCIEDEILQILDYPNYNHILSIQDKYKNNLKHQNLRLYIGLYQSNTQIQIIHASKNN